LAYKADTGYLTLPPDTYDVSIFVAGTDTEVLSTQLPVSASTNYSIFARGLVGDIDTPFGLLPLVDAVPEPGCLALVMCGLACFGLVRRRR
jgi:hypothetical protein